MKNINLYINEALVTSKPSGTYDKYEYHPGTKKELIEAITTELKAGNTDLNCIDTSQITDMSDVFNRFSNHFYIFDISNLNIDISKWNVSKVTNMYQMFSGCLNVNLSISDWDVSNVTNMGYMFANCHNFIGKEIENWDVSNVTNMDQIFSECQKFDCDLSKWNVKNVRSMEFMFGYCEKFKGKGLDKWDVSNVENMSWMFYGCKQLKCDLLNWNVSNVECMKNMFCKCIKFNSDLSGWDVSKVNDMTRMFRGCKKLDFDLSKWFIKNKCNTECLITDTPMESKYVPYKDDDVTIINNHVILK